VGERPARRCAESYEMGGEEKKREEASLSARAFLWLMPWVSFGSCSSTSQSWSFRAQPETTPEVGISKNGGSVEYK